jgi:hypothetical protein
VNEPGEPQVNHPSINTEHIYALCAQEQNKVTPAINTIDLPEKHISVMKEERAEILAAAYTQLKTDGKIVRTKVRDALGYARKYRGYEKIKRVLDELEAEQPPGQELTRRQWAALKSGHQTCPRCGKRVPDVELVADHRIPECKGGSRTSDTFQVLCRSCNASKREQTTDYRKSSNQKGASEAL